MAMHIVEKDAQMAAKDAMYQARFHQLEAMMQSRSAAKMNQVKDVPNTESPTCLMVRSSVGCGSGNAIYLHILLLNCIDCHQNLE